MTVHLVGAGCAGPLWITLEGMELLRRADAVVYDSLIHPDLLQLAPRTCEFHAAGKLKGRASLKQPEINTLLTELGKAKKTVVRLKGGDPFVFGRGGEEALALEKAGIPWTYTPGITTAIGGLGRAGIPPTHRGLADSLTLATGHSEQNGAPRETLWKAVAEGGGTLAVYMGASSWGGLARSLEANGMAPETPCAAVTRGGWGCASTVRFSLSGSPSVLPSPSVVTAGGTAGLVLSPDRGPLAGLKVAVVRPAPESWDTARFLENLGADGFSLPLLAEEELPFSGEDDLLARADWIVVTSPRGAALLSRRTDLRTLRGNIASIGPGTTAALASMGLRADGEARPSTSEALASLLSGRVQPGELVVFFRNEAGSPLPGDAVRARGAEVVNIPAYRMVPCLPPGWESYESLWEETGLDAVIFGSAALVRAWSTTGLSLPEGAVPVGWGTPCAGAAEQVLGRKALVMAEPTLESLAALLAELKKRKPTEEKE